MKIIKSLGRFSNSKSLWTFWNVTLRFFLCTMTFLLDSEQLFSRVFFFWTTFWATVINTKQFSSDGRRAPSSAGSLLPPWWPLTTRAASRGRSSLWPRWRPEVDSATPCSTRFRRIWLDPDRCPLTLRGSSTSNWLKSNKTCTVYR